MRRFLRFLGLVASTLFEALWMFAIVGALIALTQHSIVLREM